VTVQDGTLAETVAPKLRHRANADGEVEVGVCVFPPRPLAVRCPRADSRGTQVVRDVRLSDFLFESKNGGAAAAQQQQIQQAFEKQKAKSKTLD
jgi:hypothetical protein